MGFRERRVTPLSCDPLPALPTPPCGAVPAWISSCALPFSSASLVPSPGRQERLAQSEGPRSTRWPHSRETRSLFWDFRGSSAPRSRAVWRTRRFLLPGGPVAGRWVVRGPCLALGADGSGVFLTLLPAPTVLPGTAGGHRRPTCRRGPRTPVGALSLTRRGGG